MFGLHYKLETKAIALVLAIIGVSSIGGLVEIAPLFTIDQTVEEAPDMRVLTPLELAGRNIYIREGCNSCHSQMIRTLRDEVERYGPYSRAVESQYDHPMLWGSKRTGPDLARLGDKYSDAWHAAHLFNPRDLVPQSVMPAYPWLARTELNFEHIGDDLRVQAALGVQRQRVGRNHGAALQQREHAGRQLGTVGRHQGKSVRRPGREGGPNAGAPSILTP